MSNKKYIKHLVLIIFLFCSQLFSSGELLFVGGRSVGMGGAFTAVSGDIESLGYNSASLMNIEKFNSFFSTKKLYGIDDLKHSAIGIGYGVKKRSGYGFLYEEVGYSLHKEKTYQLSYGRKINRFMGLGCNVKIYEITIKNFGSDKAVGLDFSYLTRVYENLNFGLNIKNFNNPKVGSTIQKPINKSITAGLAYQTDKFTIAVDAMKEEDFDLQLRAGAEVIVFGDFALRYGYNSDPSRSFYGIGFNFKNVSISWTMYLHPYLDTTKQVCINLKF